jgi:uncharacterized protein
MNSITFSPIKLGMPVVKPQVKAPRFGADDFITVQGNGSVRRNPDTMTIGISITEVDADKAKVETTLAAKSEAVMSAIKALNLPLELQSQFSVRREERWNQKKQEQEFVGYRGTFSLSVTEHSKKASVFPEHAAQITEAAAQNGATFNGPSYGLRNEKSAAHAALAKAAVDAFKKAQTLARALGLKISKVPQAIETGNAGHSFSAPRSFAAKAAMAESAGGGAPEGALEYAPIEVSSPTVNVRFKIEGQAKKKK